MLGLKKFIKAVKDIERGCRIFSKILKYADKVMSLYPLLEGFLQRTNTSDND